MLLATLHQVHEKLQWHSLHNAPRWAPPYYSRIIALSHEKALLAAFCFLCIPSLLNDYELISWDPLLELCYDLLSPTYGLHGARWNRFAVLIIHLQSQNRLAKLLGIVSQSLGNHNDPQNEVDMSIILHSELYNFPRSIPRDKDRSALRC